MRNLWAFDWKCQKCGKKWYQGPTPKKCRETDYKGTGKPCDSKSFERKIMWVGKHNPQSTSYCFDKEPHFQYFEDWKHRPQYEKDKKEKGYTETMSLQGSCFMCTRKKYWELNLCDEKLGNWGNQGVEVALKTWLSGGRVLCNHKTWYAHMFRTQGGDFSFPWPNSGRETQKTKKNVKNLFWKSKWPKMKKPLSWLVEKFWPVPGWTDQDLKELKANEAKSAGKKATIKPADSKLTVKPLQTVAQPTAKPSKKVQEDGETNNLIQIAEGKRLIFLDVTESNKDQPPGQKSKQGVTYAIEPSKKILHFADDEIKLKIFIEESG
jgi:hypothetical protein